MATPFMLDAPVDAGAQITPSFSTLADMKKGDEGVVARVRGSDGEEESAIRTRLIELGFVPGERIRVVAQSIFGGMPLAIRLGSSTFALRRHEAEFIEILPPP